MKTILLLCFLTLRCLSSVAQQENRIENELKSVQSKQAEFDKKLGQLSTASNINKCDIRILKQRNEVLCEKIDSLKTICDSLKNVQVADRTTINGKIQETNNTVFSNQSIMEIRTLWGGIIAVVILLVSLVIFYYLTKRIKKGTSSIDEVRKVQNALQKAHVKMQEESVKLDNRMIELFEKQMLTGSTMLTGTQIDHSLALKVADEIVRIEMNLSHMDSSIKGYKQLTKAVQRIKDNFNANGYEIVDMLGKPYNAGMKVVANFVADDGLAFGLQIITGIIKPQINYNGQMIQAAQITVSQNI